MLSLCLCLLREGGERLKYSELHRLIKRAGWIEDRQAGSHVIYKRGGDILSVPFHGSKEVPVGTEKQIRARAGV